MDQDVKKIIPVTVIIPTADRLAILKRTLESLSGQDFQPKEIIIIDASGEGYTKEMVPEKIETQDSALKWLRASKKGAAIQRSQGIISCQSPFILFMDDDIILEPGCIRELWTCLQSHPNAAGVNAMVTNQKYLNPGRFTKWMYRLMSGENLGSYAGKCIGPAWNLLPEDNPASGNCNRIEWLNTTCTLYRKESLPNPVFDSIFFGYSLMEDLALSLHVGKNYELYNARLARIFHDSQPGSHKSDIRLVSKMELVNRHYIMSRILGKAKISDYLKLFLFEGWGVATSLTSGRGWKNLLPVLAGKATAFYSIISTKTNS